MSEARDEYYKLKIDVFLCSHEGLVPAVENYVTELEQEKSELIEILKKIRSLCKSNAVTNHLDQIFVVSDITIRKHTTEVKG